VSTREPREIRSAYRGRFVSVDIEDWPAVGSWEVVRMPDAAAVLPLTPDGDVLLVSQFRPPIRDHLVEIPAGIMDVPGEDAVTCAARELVEETGYRHTRIEFLGGMYAAPGSTAHYIHLFVARTAEASEGEVEEGIELSRRPFAQMVAAARSGRVRDAKTALALLLAAGRPSLP
jgi:ADP-ribose pyrophosphatase